MVPLGYFLLSGPLIMSPSTESLPAGSTCSPGGPLEVDILITVERSFSFHRNKVSPEHQGAPPYDPSAIRSALGSVPHFLDLSRKALLQSETYVVNVPALIKSMLWYERARSQSG
jgi:hypothetical protein